MIDFAMDRNPAAKIRGPYRGLTIEKLAVMAEIFTRRTACVLSGNRNAVGVGQGDRERPDVHEP